MKSISKVNWGKYVALALTIGIAIGIVAPLVAKAVEKGKEFVTKKPA
jgi:hypothetical protein